MNEPLFLTEYHATSNRNVVVVDEGSSVWCYLTEPNGDNPIADCWLLNTIDAPENLDDFGSSESAPPATRRYVTDAAKRALPSEASIKLLWSKDGESVAVYVGRELLGFIAHNIPRGFSTNLREEGPFGSPLDRELFSMFFMSA